MSFNLMVVSLLLLLCLYRTAQCVSGKKPNSYYNMLWSITTCYVSRGDLIYDQDGLNFQEQVRIV